MLEAFEGYLHRTRRSGRLGVFEVTSIGSKVEGIDGQVVAESAGGWGAVEIIIVLIYVVLKAAAGCPGMNGSELFFCKAHAMGNLYERALNRVCLEISGTLIARERDCGGACAGLGVGPEVINGEEGDEMGEEGMLRDAGALRHREWMRRGRRREG